MKFQLRKCKNCGFRYLYPTTTYCPNKCNNPAAMGTYIEDEFIVPDKSLKRWLTPDIDPNMTRGM